MALDFYFGSGSQYAWRVWLALEHKGIPYELKVLSFAAGDTTKPEFVAINPRHQVPTIVDDGFALYESGAILEYLEDKYPSSGQRLFPTDIRQRATARRLESEVTSYVGAALEPLLQEVLFTKAEEFNPEAIAEARKGFAAELAFFERYAPAAGFFVGNAGAVDLTLYPWLALALRMDRKKSDLDVRSTIPPKITAWMKRVEQLPYFEKTIPPHWKKK